MVLLIDSQAGRRLSRLDGQSGGGVPQGPDRVGELGRRRAEGAGRDHSGGCDAHQRSEWMAVSQHVDCRSGWEV